MTAIERARFDISPHFVARAAQLAADTQSEISGVGIRAA
jgi:hypothetical protein